MQMMRDGELQLSTDFDQIVRHVPSTDGHWLELGCGAAFTARRLAERFPALRITAFEVDRVQHEKNLMIPDLPLVEFRLGGAQAIDLPPASVDAVIMLKSLHHVPTGDMQAAMSEIARVLRPGGLAYISEPVYAGAFNDIMRLFNDEKRVREAAFGAIRQAIDAGLLLLREQLHFQTLTLFQGFEEFERRILGATHSEYDIDDALYARIREAFMSHVDDSGQAQFVSPHRVDLLMKPA